MQFWRPVLNASQRCAPLEVFLMAYAGRPSSHRDGRHCFASAPHAAVLRCKAQLGMPMQVPAQPEFEPVASVERTKTTSLSQFVSTRPSQPGTHTHVAQDRNAAPPTHVLACRELKLEVRSSCAHGCACAAPATAWTRCGRTFRQHGAADVGVARQAAERAGGHGREAAQALVEDRV